MGISDVQIRQILREKLESIAGLPADNDWQGRTFKAKDGVPYMRETLLKASEQITGHDELTGLGIYQIDYFAPMNASLPDGEGKAEAIKKAFEPPQTLENLVQIERAELMNSRSQGPWQSYPVRIYFRIFGTINGD